MLNEKIEFYGEMLSMLAISKKIGITNVTLKKYYEKTGDIYQAEKICREILLQKKNSLINYNGEMLAIETIAKRVGVKDPKTLRKYYNETGNIEEAIKRYNANKIEYNGDMLTINAIAKKEGLKGDTLKKYYGELGDIYQAVEKCLELRKKQDESKFLYEGKLQGITEIANVLKIGKSSLKKCYDETGDIYKAIELYNQKKQEIEETKVKYNGERKFLRAIARDENIAENTLYRYYKKYGNINKAVYMAKIQRIKTKKIKMKDSELNVLDLSIILGIKESVLINMLNSGMKIDDIKKLKIKNTRNSLGKTNKVTLSNGQPLLNYCIENGLNFYCIYYIINSYGKTPEEAIEHYKLYGQEIPQKWIYEKYDILLKHLLLHYNIDVQKVVYYMRKENISLNNALEEYILRKNAREINTDYEWINELYAVLTDENMQEEYDDFKSAFYVTNEEEECIIQSYDEIDRLQRELLLYEIADAFKNNVFNENEKIEVLQVYDITDEEVETIFLGFYNYFGDKIKLNDSKRQRKDEIAEITKKWHYLTEEQRNKILQDKSVTQSEQKTIETLSHEIVKYIQAIHIKDNNEKGINFNGE